MTIKLHFNLNIFLLLFPLTLILFIPIVLPSGWALILSFHKYQLGKTMQFIGFQNYIEVLSDLDGFWNSTIKTLVFTSSIVLGELCLGLAFSLLLARGFPLQRFWVALLIAPMAVSPVVAIIVWKYMLTPNYGIINYAISIVGIRPPNWFISGFYAFIAIGIIDIWLSTPFVMTILYPTIIAISPSLFDAARIDGASYLQIFKFITLPLIKPAILTTLIFRVIFGLRLFSPIWLFAGGGPADATRVLSIYLYEQGFKWGHFGLGSAVGWFILIVTLIVALPQVNAMRKTMFK